MGLEIKGEGKELSAIHNALVIEQKEFDRSSIAVSRKKGCIEITIRASDKVALFAGVNSIMTILRALPAD